ncbi:MAG TPA: hypothetical protein DDW50_01980 [Firmicutes bacterium]|nr:hypothetical protein [Bacillota bacterium]
MNIIYSGSNAKPAGFTLNGRLLKFHNLIQLLLKPGNRLHFVYKVRREKGSENPPTGGRIFKTNPAVLKMN